MNASVQLDFICNYIVHNIELYYGKISVDNGLPGTSCIVTIRQAILENYNFFNISCNNISTRYSKK